MSDPIARWKAARMRERKSDLIDDLSSAYAHINELEDTLESIIESAVNLSEAVRSGDPALVTEAADDLEFEVEFAVTEQVDLFDAIKGTGVTEAAEP